MLKIKVPIGALSNPRLGKVWGVPKGPIRKMDNPRYIANCGRKARYGLTPERHAEMLREQDHRCPITLDPINVSSPVDHCHTTGKLRQVLSDRANKILGFAKDDIEVLERAIAYLKAHAAR